MWDFQTVALDTERAGRTSNVRPARELGLQVIYFAAATEVAFAPAVAADSLANDSVSD